MGTRILNVWYKRTFITFIFCSSVSISNAETSDQSGAPIDNEKRAWPATATTKNFLPALTATLHSDPNDISGFDELTSTPNSSLASKINRKTAAGYSEENDNSSAEESTSTTSASFFEKTTQKKRVKLTVGYSDDDQSGYSKDRGVTASSSRPTPVYGIDELRENEITTRSTNLNTKKRVKSAKSRVTMFNGDAASIRLDNSVNSDWWKVVTSDFSVQDVTPATVFFLSSDSGQSTFGQSSSSGSAVSGTFSAGNNQVSGSASSGNFQSEAGSSVATSNSGATRSKFGSLSKEKKTKVIGAVVSGIVQNIIAARKNLSSSNSTAGNQNVVVTFTSNGTQGRSSLSLPVAGPMPLSPTVQPPPNFAGPIQDSSTSSQESFSQNDQSNDIMVGQTDGYRGGSNSGSGYGGREGRSLGDGYSGSGGSGWGGGGTINMNIPPIPYPPQVPAPFMIGIPPPPGPPPIPNIGPPPMPNFNINMPPAPPFPDMPAMPPMQNIQFPPFPSMSSGWGSGGGGWSRKK